MQSKGPNLYGDQRLLAKCQVLQLPSLLFSDPVRDKTASLLHFLFLQGCSVWSLTSSWELEQTKTASKNRSLALIQRVSTKPIWKCLAQPGTITTKGNCRKKKRGVPIHSSRQLCDAFAHHTNLFGFFSSKDTVVSILHQGYEWGSVREKEREERGGEEERGREGERENINISTLAAPL